MAIEIRIKKIDSNAIIPVYKTEMSSGMDIFSNEVYKLKAGEIYPISTGIAIEIPVGFEIQIRPRSGLALKHGIGILNSPGTIDADYRGEIKVILFNFSKEPYEINIGDRIAQLVLTKVNKICWVMTNELSDTDRGKGGFGHTGY